VAEGRPAPASPDAATMPSLFRFLMFLGLIGGLAYGAVFSLANFVKYQPREIIVTIPPGKFVKQQQ
jgi:bacteriorhodopsin